jgi:uncharacterized membrane protein
LASSSLENARGLSKWFEAGAVFGEEAYRIERNVHRGSWIGEIEGFRSSAVLRGIVAGLEQEQWRAAPVLKDFAGVTSSRLVASLESELAEARSDGKPLLHNRHGNPLCDLCEVVMLQLQDSSLVDCDEAVVQEDRISAEPDNLFRQRGEIWEIRYAGGEKLAYRPVDGLWYIAQLICRPGRGVSPVELRRELASYRGKQLPRLNEEHGVEVTDRAMRRDIKQELRDLNKEIEEATRDNDPSRKEKAESERQEIIETLESSQGLGGASRRVGNEVKKHTDAVRYAINGVLKKLEARDRDCWLHLKNSLNLDTVYVYEPEPSVDWVL